MIPYAYAGFLFSMSNITKSYDPVAKSLPNWSILIRRYLSVTGIIADRKGRRQADTNPVGTPPDNLLFQ